MKAKVFNEEKLIREKMKKMASAHDTKVIMYIISHFSWLVMVIVFAEEGF